MKYVSPDGHYEAVRDRDGNLVTDSANLGTYNYYPLWDLRHLPADIIPYWIWGNAPDDLTPVWNRVFGSGPPILLDHRQ